MSFQVAIVDVGQCFEAKWADINNDGVMEILASCYDKVNEVGNFVVYEQDWNNTDNPWKKTILATDFIANSYLFGSSMVPGIKTFSWDTLQFGNGL